MTVLRDLVLVGLLVTATVGIITAVRWSGRGHSSRPYIVGIFIVLALVTVWVGSNGSFRTRSPRQTAVSSATRVNADRDHSEMFADDGELVGSDMLAQRLVHLSERSLVVTAEQQATASLLKQATERATRPYAQMAAAEAEGYVRLADDAPSPEQRFLYDRNLVRDGTWIEPGRPQALVYLRASDASYHLVGAVFLTPAGEGPALGGGLTIWFPHRALCLDASQYVVAKERAGAGCPAGTRAVSHQIAALYVWLFDNPNGSFAGGLSREAAEIARRQRIAG